MAWSKLGWVRNLLGQFLGLFIVVGLFEYLTTDPFVTLDNVRAVGIQTAITATCGVGMTLIIIGGGIDLSVGSAISLTAVVVALVFNGEFFSRVNETLFLKHTWVAWTTGCALTGWTAYSVQRAYKSVVKTVATVVLLWGCGCLIFHQQGGLAAVVAGVLAGTAFGFLNAYLITTTRVVPFIITLGTMEIFRGAAQLLAKGESVSLGDAADADDWVFQMMSTSMDDAWLGLGIGIWIMIVSGLFAAFLLRWIPLGRYFFAIGSNEQAAVLSGIRVRRVKLWMYSLAGLATGLAGVLNFSRLNYGSSTAATGLELDVIAAVVIGGGSLRGGEGSILGTFIGAFIMGFMRYGCGQAGIPNSVQRILIGSMIVLAVALDEWRHRRS